MTRATRKLLFNKVSTNLLTNEVENLFHWVQGPELPKPLVVACLITLNDQESKHFLLSQRATEDVNQFKAESWIYDWDNVRAFPVLIYLSNKSIWLLAWLGTHWFLPW